jgi:NAD(P)-dependent dehydrogenase (short-subunit alcohol dehydrogenase family)
MEYQGKVAMVSGASSGIGAAIAQELGRRGALLILVSRRAEVLAEKAEAVQAAGGEAVVMPCDVTDETAVREMVRRVDDQFHRLDLLVNNAGVMVWAPLPVLRVDDARDMLALNVFSTWFLVRCCAPLLPKGSGAVVNIASAAGLQGASGMSAYSASKGAVMAMTRSLAKELAPRRVRVNAVAPGVVVTEASQRKFALLSEKQLSALQAQHPLGFGTPEDVARAVAFLGSDQAAWITGHTLVVDGGLTA